MMKAEIHRILQNPIYTGDFRWNGKLYHGSHEPLISREHVRRRPSRAQRQAPRALSETAPRVHGPADLRPVRLLDDRRAQEGQVHATTAARASKAPAETPTSARSALADLLGEVIERIQIPADRRRRDRRGAPRPADADLEQDASGTPSPRSTQRRRAPAIEARPRVSTTTSRVGSQTRSGRGNRPSGRRSSRRRRVEPTRRAATPGATWSRQARGF